MVSTTPSTAPAVGEAAASKPPVQTVQGKDGKPLKICCACPETKKIRDECVIRNGEPACSDAIETHKKCLRALGFDI
jgi:cytochrome c oxidase assembly protein subunit 17